MEYNSSREKLVIREYGRNIQSLIRFTAKVEDRDKRNWLAHQIIEMMSQLNPQMKNIDEYRQKLWDHLYVIADFDIDIDSPFPKPSPEVALPTNDNTRMPYPRDDVKFKHYGKNVEIMIEKAMNMEDEDKQKEFGEIIGNYMKMVSQNWNRDNINDDIIKTDIETMSNGKLSLAKDSNLDALRHSNKRKKRPTRAQGPSGRRSNVKRRGKR